MELPFRKPINTRKSRRTVTAKDTFTEEKYWKSRKNRVLHQLSRSDNEADHDEFLLPEKRLTRWDIRMLHTNAEQDKAEWHASADKLVPAQLGAGWDLLDDWMPPKSAFQEHFTVNPALQDYYAANDDLAYTNIMNELNFNIYLQRFSRR
jgi:hypothetical protein